MDFSTGLSTVSTLLDIKNKLLPQKKEVSVAKENASNSPYCSLCIDYTFTEGFTEEDSSHEIQVVLAKKSEFTIPIWHLDWLFLESKLEAFKPIDFDIPELWLVDQRGALLRTSISSILQAHIGYLNLSSKQLDNALKDLSLRCVYADGYVQKVEAPEMLRRATAQWHSKNRS